MSLFESKFKTALSSNVPLLDKIMYYIIKRKGKRMRPMFVFLAAKVFGKCDENTFLSASMIELLHTATLVHDDVIDDANFRRGFFSINALWKNKVAVLVGDFLLSKGLLLAVKNKQYKLLEIVSKAVQDMSEGELLQIEKSRKLDITESVYLDIINQKTASLIAACCASGASSVTDNEKDIENMKLFGTKAGIAFQIKDDLFDYLQAPLIGKPKGLDIREGKLTLPLIYSLGKSNKKTKNFYLKILKNKNKSEKEISDIINFVKSSGGVEYAQKKMKLFHDEAFNILDNFKDCAAKNSLRMLLDYVINRKK